MPLLQPGHSLRFATLPPGEDPDSLIRQAGRAGVRGSCSRRRGRCHDTLWEFELGARPVDTPERRADLERRLTEDVALIADRSVRAEYRRFVREKLYEAGDRRGSPRSRPPMHATVPHSSDDGPPPPPRARRRACSERLLFRILLRSPSLIDEVAEEFAAIEIPEAELDKLRREILEIEALRPGLDASALRQHLLLNGFAATVDALLSPSVDSGFLVRSSDSRTARNEWAHVIEMLMGGHRSALAEASNHLIDDVSAASWERFLAARERALQRGSAR